MFLTSGAQDRAPPLGVYVHWPYCARICPYCDFNVYRRREIDASRWASALIQDLKGWADRTPDRRLSSLYFGGGTPSLAPIDVIERVIGACADLWGFEDGAEVTLEANPTDAELSRFAEFRRAGVNRLSLGVQSFDDAALEFLKRNHDGAAARRALDLALAAFPNVTFDLIYALPEQSLEAWRSALREALGFRPSHISLYQLTIEKGTAFDRAAGRGLFRPPADDIAAELFDVAQEETERAGLPAYEISNHARPGAQSRHNLLYWTGGDYVGVGPGAHGRLTLGAERLATETHARPERYLAAIESAGSGAAATESLSREARLAEKLAMGLRLVDGTELDAADVAQLGPRARRLNDLSADGLLRFHQGRLAATASGRRVLNAVLAALLC